MTRTTDSASISYSEADTLMRCEQRWDYLYRQGFDEKGRGLAFGTAWHAFSDDWWMGRFAGHDGPLPHYGVPEEDLERLTWLMERYLRHYGPEPEGFEMVASEFEGSIPSLVRGVEITFHVDKVVRHLATGGLWVVETKTYGSRQRLALTDVTLQETGYVKGVSASLAEDVEGVLFDGVYTYRWKPAKPTQAALKEEHPRGQNETAAEHKERIKRIQDLHPGVERPDADSFDRIWMSREGEQIEEWEQIMREVILRRGNLLVGDRRPLPSIGTGCRSCPARTECWTTLVGREDYGNPIDWSDDDEDLPDE